MIARLTARPVQPGGGMRGSQIGDEILAGCELPRTWSAALASFSLLIFIRSGRRR